MIFRNVHLPALALAALCLVAAGCGPVAESGLEEQREPHFLTGKARAQALDYNGAIDAFEQALEVNPRSASSHFELGLLYSDEQHANDPASAIYHFQRFLRLRPGSEHAEIVKQRIFACKQELARAISVTPGTQQSQREIEQFRADNITLRKQVEELQRLLSQRPAAVTNYILGTPTASSVTPTPPSPSPRVTPIPNANPPTAARTHTIQPGENPSNIARKYAVSVASLMAANPGINPNKLKPGQTLKIPAP
ncbi:MAG: LysM peptidoglycan-binding domain-containing protein [Verrucomicrobia bacterium]|nr:LysM peptidoglycan-binding domain-containing protein [Verrucomicrobiota bacterium]